MLRGNPGFLVSLGLALTSGLVEEAASSEIRRQVRADLVTVPAAIFVGRWTARRFRSQPCQFAPC